MDSLTQIVLGIATAEVCAGKKLQNKTFWYGAILGTIPDLDVVVGNFLSDVDGVSIHRGFSHSIVFFLLASPIFGWVITALEKGKISFKSASVMAFCCLLTHVLLDAFTTWGTQILWPLPYRFALESIFVIDPLYTLPLLISLIYVWRNKENFKRQKYVKIGLGISSFYLLLGCGLKWHTQQKFEDALTNQNIAFEKIIVKPTPMNCILWNANIDTQTAYLMGEYSLFDSQPITFKSYPKARTIESRLKGNSDFEKLKDISEGWYLVTEKDRKLHFNDLRFGMFDDNPENPEFVFSYRFENVDGKLQAFETEKNPKDGKALMKKLLNRVKGN